MIGGFLADAHAPGFQDADLLGDGLEFASTCLLGQIRGPLVAQRPSFVLPHVRVHKDCFTGNILNQAPVVFGDANSTKIEKTSSASKGPRVRTDEDDLWRVYGRRS